MTALITSLTDLLQANHQGQIGTSKTKSTCSPVLAWEQPPGEDGKNFKEREIVELGERSKRGGMRERVDFDFDVPIRTW